MQRSLRQKYQFLGYGTQRPCRSMGGRDDRLALTHVNLFSSSSNKWFELAPAVAERKTSVQAIAETWLAEKDHIGGRSRQIFYIYCRDKNKGCQGGRLTILVGKWINEAGSQLKFCTKIVQLFAFMPPIPSMRPKLPAYGGFMCRPERGFFAPK